MAAAAIARLALRQPRPGHLSPVIEAAGGSVLVIRLSYQVFGKSNRFLLTPGDSASAESKGCNHLFTILDHQ
jgi:hypothetical protein